MIFKKIHPSRSKTVSLILYMSAWSAPEGKTNRCHIMKSRDRTSGSTRAVRIFWPYMQQYCPNCQTHNPVRNGKHTTLGISSVSAPHLRTRKWICRMQNIDTEYHIHGYKVRVWGMGRISIRITVGVIMAFMWCGAKKSIVKKVLVLAILFTSIVNNPAKSWLCVCVLATYIM